MKVDANPMQGPLPGQDGARAPGAPASQTQTGQAGQPQPLTASQQVAMGSVQSISQSYGQSAAQSAGGVQRADQVTFSADALSALSQRSLETEVGEQISAAFAEAGVDLSQGVGMDFSVDATAGRIADFATGMFDSFREQNPELNDEQAAAGFESMVRGAVDEGASRAFDALENMEASNEVRETARQTMTEVHSLLDGFFGRLAATEETTKAPGAT